MLVTFILLGCAPIVYEMPDKQHYNDAKLRYDSLSKTSPDSLYEQCDDMFGELIDEFPASSYRDNAHYYRGRLYQKWTDVAESSYSTDELLITGIPHFKKIQSNEPFYNEALYRIAQSFDDLYELDNVDIEVVIAAYEKALSVSPNGSESDKISNRLEELDHAQ